VLNRVASEEEGEEEEKKNEGFQCVLLGREDKKDYFVLYKENIP